MGEDRLPYCMMYGKIEGNLVSRKKRWKDTIKKDLLEVGLTMETWEEEEAQDRERWTKICKRQGSEVERKTEILQCDKCRKPGIRGKRGMAAHNRYCGPDRSARGVIPEGILLAWLEEGRVEKVFKCSSCVLSMATLAGARRHTKAQCDKSRSSNRGLSDRDSQTQTGCWGRPTRPCLGCNKKFSTAGHLTQHRNKTKTPECKSPCYY